MKSLRQNVSWRLGSLPWAISGTRKAGTQTPSSHLSSFQLCIPTSGAAKFGILLLCISVEFFSSSAVGKKPLFLPFSNWVLSDLFAPRAQGWVVPPVIYEDLIRSRYPVTGGTACRTEKTAAFRCWVTALLSVQDQLLQKHNFYRYHHFLCLSWHLIFCFLTLYFGLAQLALA